MRKYDGEVDDLNEVREVDQAGEVCGLLTLHFTYSRFQEYDEWDDYK